MDRWLSNSIFIACIFFSFSLSTFFASVAGIRTTDFCVGHHFIIVALLKIHKTAFAHKYIYVGMEENVYV